MKTNQIQAILRSRNTTEIFKMCAGLGIDVSKRGNVCNFIKEHAPELSAYSLSYGAGDFKNMRYPYQSDLIDNRILNAISHAKQEKADGQSNYSKIMVLGHRNIYWASPVFLHDDYNKSIAMPNTEKNRKLATLINKFLGYEFN